MIMGADALKNNLGNPAAAISTQSKLSVPTKSNNSEGENIFK